MEHYENFKRDGYWQKLCLNCKNHEIIVNSGYRVDLYFRRDYLNANIMNVNLSSESIASKCAGWSWIGKEIRAA